MTAFLLTHTEAEQATGGQSSAPWRARGLSIDSRTVNPGDLFIALTGERHDGHAFIGAAAAKGAAAALASKAWAQANPYGDLPLLMVDDVAEGLRALARHARRTTRARVTQITGSVGKTSVKEGLACVLAAYGPTHATTGNLNNHIGLPLTLARMAPGAAFAVLESGMNHPGEIRAAAQLTRPHVAVITAIAPAHLAFFDSVAQIADAKAEICAGIEPGGALILPRDSDQYPRLLAAARAAGVGSILTFGLHPDSTVRLLDAQEDSSGQQVTASCQGRRVSFPLAASGRHHAVNSLAILAAVSALGRDPIDAAARLSLWRPLRGRGDRCAVRLPGGGRFLLIDESYNANPASMQAAIAVLGQAPLGPGGRRIAVLGDMGELGQQAAQFHQALAEPLQAARTDLVLTAGPLMERLAESLPPALRGARAADGAALAPLAARTVRAGDAVMVKGSRALAMEAVVHALRALDEAGKETRRAL